MDQNNKKFGSAESLFFLAVIFTVLGMSVQCIAVLFGYDASMHVFKFGSVLGTVSTVVLFILVALISFFSYMTVNGNKSEKPLYVDNLTAFLSAVSGSAIVSSSAIICFETIDVTGPLRIVSLLLFLTSIPAGIYYVLFALSDEKYKKTRMVFGFFPPIWGAAFLMRIYFDDTSVINDPIRILFQLSVVAIMLAFLYELRLRIDKNGITAFVITSFVSLILGFSSGLSMFMLYFITRTVTTGEMLLSASEILICLYLIVRSSSHIKKEED